MRAAASRAAQQKDTPVNPCLEPMEENMNKVLIAKFAVAGLVALPLTVGCAAAGSSSSAASRYAGQYRESSAQTGKANVPLTEFSSAARKSPPKH
jgi:hypothetical protein